MADKNKASSVQEVELVILGLNNPNNNFQRKKYMIYPNDRCKIWWDVILSIVLLISCFQSPLDVAFTGLFDDFAWFLIAIDICFLMDIFVNFTTAFQDLEYNIIDDRKTICKNYLMTWFLLDVVAILPFDLMMD